MIHVENCVVIEKPAGEVFDVVGDPARDPEWHFDVVEAAPENGVKAKAGARYRWVFDYMGEGRQPATVEVRGYERNRLLEVFADAGPLVQTISYRLEPVGTSSTLVTRLLDLEHAEMPPAAEPEMKPRIENRGAQYLARLRQVLEKGAAGEPPRGSCACCEG